MRRVLPMLLGAAVVLAALYGLVSVLAKRDSSGVAQQAAQGPGELEPVETGRPSAGAEPPTSGAHRRRAIARQDRMGLDGLLTALEQGNVVIVYPSGGQPPPALVRLQEEISGAFDPELAAAGQTVVLAPWEGVDGLQALAYRRRLRARGPRDPRLRDFAQAWLGQGRGNTD